LQVRKIRKLITIKYKLNKVNYFLSTLGAR